MIAARLFPFTSNYANATRRRDPPNHQPVDPSRSGQNLFEPSSATSGDGQAHLSLSLSIVYTVLWMPANAAQSTGCDVVIDYICLLMSVEEQQQELEISLMLGVSCLTLRSWISTDVCWAEQYSAAAGLIVSPAVGRCSVRRLGGLLTCRPAQESQTESESWKMYRRKWGGI